MTIQSIESLEKRALGTVLHVGAGCGDGLEDTLSLPAKRVVLVEPNPACLPPLQRIAQANSRVTLLEAAVSAQDSPPDTAPLHVWNTTALASLRDATGLRRLFPGLREVTTPTVRLMSVQALLAHCAPKAEDANLLILDAPGETGAIIEQLARSGALDQFRHLVVHLPTSGLFENSEDAAASLARLSAAGYEIVEQHDERIGFARYQLRLDAKRALQKRLDKMEARAKSAEDGMKDRDERLKALQETVAEKEEACEAALRGQALARSDLADLRRRYEKLQAEQAEIAALLLQFTSHLRTLSTALEPTKRTKPGDLSKPRGETG